LEEAQPVENLGDSCGAGGGSAGSGSRGRSGSHSGGSGPGGYGESRLSDEEIARIAQIVSHVINRSKDVGHRECMCWRTEEIGYSVEM
jgi:hypothetical protein